MPAVMSRRGFARLATALLSATFAGASEAEGAADFRIISGSEAVVPISIESGAVIVDASMNGRGPFPLMFDTGAENALTKETAAALGLKTEGTETALDSGGRQVSIAYTRLKNVGLSGVEMTDQRFAVLALPPYLKDRGNRPPLAGFLGYGLLERFAVRLSYQDATLTLKPGSDFRYDGTGTRVPLTFAAKTPAVPGTADGISGMFMLKCDRRGRCHRQCRAGRTRHGISPLRRRSADSGGSRPAFRDDVAHHSDLISLGVPR